MIVWQQQGPLKNDGDATEDDEQVCGIACERGGSDALLCLTIYFVGRIATHYYAFTYISCV